MLNIDATFRAAHDPMFVNGYPASCPYDPAGLITAEALDGQRFFIPFIPETRPRGVSRNGVPLLEIVGVRCPYCNMLLRYLGASKENINDNIYPAVPGIGGKDG